MAAATLWLAWDLELRSSAPQNVKALRDLFKFEVALMCGCAVLTAARVYLWYRQLVATAPDAAGQREAVRLYDLVFLALAMGGEVVLWRARLLAKLVRRLGARPPMLLATSFASMILISTLLLCMPWAVNDVKDVSLLDALFTSTSAVCVTGLVVNDVGTTYSSFGQLVILLAIQFGGIGIMSLGAMAVTLRRDSSLAAQAGYASMFEATSLSELRGLVRTIVTSTLAIEAVGALGLWLTFDGDPRLEGRSAAWCAAFHSVSAFCNAGFALFPGNFAPFTSRLAPQLVLMSLIVVGGLGFPVYRALYQRLRNALVARLRGRQHEPQRFEISARVVLVTTAILIVAGTFAFAVIEWRVAFDGYGFVDRLTAALFASVTTRTAGFNTIDIAALSTPALLVAMVLMFIGGSPSSTAGGVKTTTAAVLYAMFVGETRRHEPRLFDRVLGAETLRRAVAVLFSVAMVHILVVFLLSITERHGFLQLAFEATSALGTVGLSTGITESLSAAGRVVIIAAMFVGRIGPMTVALAIGGHGTRERFRHPSDEVAIW